ncbi:MAG TPA: hypothetical protein VIG97_07290 [Luteimonas sp.]
MPGRSRAMVATAMMLALAGIGGTAAPAQKRSRVLQTDYESRTPENLSARQAKRQAKLARRAAKAQHDARIAEARNGG